MIVVQNSEDMGIQVIVKFSEAIIIITRLNIICIRKCYKFYIKGMIEMIMVSESVYVISIKSRISSKNCTYRI